MLNLATVAETNARVHPNRLSIMADTATLTHRELNEAANRVANGLTDLGVGSGDRVALSCLTNPYFPICYYGILKTGAVVAALNPLLKHDEIARNLEDAKAAAYICHDGAGQLPLALEGRAAFDAVPTCRTFVLIADGGAVPSATRDTLLWDDLIGGQATCYDTVQTDGDAPCNIIFTSGTTGRAKGAELTHTNYVVSCLAFRDIMGYTCSDVVLATAPMFSVLGQALLMGSGFAAGATLVLQSRFDPDSVLAAMTKHRVTVFSGVPTMFYALLHHPRLHDHDLDAIRSHWRKGIVGGAPIPPTLTEEIEAVFGVKLLKGYGLSETTAVVATTREGRPCPRESVGVPIWGAEIRIVDSSMQDAPVGSPGEIVVRGPMVMKGYYGRADATAEAFRGGWFHTGDVGKLDADGNLYILDRIKDMIIRAGFNVYPCQVEAVLMSHPDIRLAAVIGVPDARLGEEVRAYIQLKEGAVLSAEAVMAWSRERIAAHAYPRQVEFISDMPLGPTNKVFKAEFRRRIAL